MAAELRNMYGKYGYYLGCDPEVFVVREAGQIRKRVAPVSSEKILPPGDPVQNNPYVSRDGVQVELHAYSSGCRQSLGYSIQGAFAQLAAYVTQAQIKDPTIKVTFAPLVTLTKGDMKQMSPESLILNCKPSLNAYGREAVLRDGHEYPIRTASGHLHLGSALFQHLRNLGHIDEAVRIFDVLVGITCVLIDQDPSQAIRRETYGRAGEYRLPIHGLEYRVPGNFWLKDHILQSGIFAIARLAAKACEGLTATKDSDAVWAKNALTKEVDFAEVERVINANDFDGALRIYTKTIRPFADALVPNAGFGKGLMDNFEYFVHRIREKGLESWFEVDDASTLTRWINVNTGVGWERFLTETVGRRRAKSSFTGFILLPSVPHPKDNPISAGLISGASDLRVAA